MKKIVVLGSTGSIGRQTLDIVRAFPDVFDVVGLAAGNNVELLLDQIQEFAPRFMYCANPPSSLPDGVEFIGMRDMVASTR